MAISERIKKLARSAVSKKPIGRLERQTARDSKANTPYLDKNSPDPLIKILRKIKDHRILTET